MARARIAIAIDRPIEDVFAVLTNVELTERWFPMQVKEHWTSPPPHGIGSTRHAVITMFGRRSENDATVSEYEPPRRAAMIGTSQGVTFAAALDFDTNGTQTLVAVTLDFEARGAMRLVMGPYMRWYRGQWDRGLVELKRMMETREL